MAPDRDLSTLLESLRASMTSNLAQLDALAAAVLAASPAAPASPRKRRVAYRGKIAPTDLERAQARALLKRMGVGV